MGLIGTFCFPVFGWGFGAAPKEAGPGEQPFGVCLVVREGAGALLGLAHTVSLGRPWLPSLDARGCLQTGFGGPVGSWTCISGLSRRRSFTVVGFVWGWDSAGRLHRAGAHGG